MRAIGLGDSAQKRGKSAKIREFSRKFIHSFSRNLVLDSAGINLVGITTTSTLYK
jgi:hypothetical protein